MLPNVKKQMCLKRIYKLLKAWN